MKYFCYMLLFSAITPAGVRAQSKLPIARFKSADSTRPLIFYISGDGGFNKFSTSFMQTLNNQGFAVIGLDAKSYFWSKKTPAETAHVVDSTIAATDKEWKKRSTVLIGYSFGADVAPFVYTRLSPAVKKSVSRVVLLSPSSKTDFEIHVLQMMGLGRSSGENVAAEINKVTIPVTIVCGDDEKEFPFGDLKMANKQVIKIPGGHHYDGDVNGLTHSLLGQLK